ncbi:MAG TPA: M15 family metallopeptidase [Thermoanaerobaculia bacterium]
MQALKEGSTGAAVKRWQHFLIGQGFDPGLADGKFGPKTHQATIEFQVKHGLIADGVVGNATMGQAMVLGLPVVQTKDEEEDDKSSPNFPPKPGFKPLTSTTERQALFGKFAFVPAPLPNDKENIRITDNWEAQNIVKVMVPQVVGVQGAPSSGGVRFHKKAAGQLQALWQAWDQAGLRHLILTWGGSFVPRFIRGSNKTLSNHAFGSAFDINMKWNGLGAVPVLVGQTGSVRLLVEIANKNGFYWGGHFTRLDGMHFEVAKLL